MSLVAVEGLTVRRGPCPVVDRVTLAVGRGELVGLIGPNGAGKTTLMRAALGLVRAEGRVTLGGDALEALGARARALRAAYLPQEREIAWPLEAEALVALGRHPHRRPGAPLSAADREAVDRALARADAEALRHRPATELSGGERARVLIARALAQEAPLIFADEPTAGLDPAHQLHLMRTLTRLAAEGTGVLISLHDLTLAARHCHRLVLMHQGRIAAEGPPEAVLTPERLAAIYGITAHMGRDAHGPIVLPTGLTGLGIGP
jgi:iron complex transport system ATP-binding protein